MRGGNSLDILLHALHPDREQASHAYEALRSRLIRFFAWNQIETAEELADEALDRLMQRLSSTAADRRAEILEPVKYAAGIARHLVQEHQRQIQRKRAVLESLMERRKSLDAAERERKEELEMLSALEQSMQQIPIENRLLIERYYSAECRNQIQQRQQLAEDLGISINALRNRALRIRMELRDQLRQLEAKNDSL